jgi:hypothetical protein
MSVIAALVHAVLFGALALDLGQGGARFLVLLLTLPLLVLHVLVWLAARFAPLGAALIAATLLNLIWVAAGIGFIAVTAPAPAPLRGLTLHHAGLFLAAGLAASGLVIAWVRFTRPPQP